MGKQLPMIAAIAVVALTCISFAHAEPFIDTVTVGNPDNVGEPSGAGSPNRRSTQFVSLPRQAALPSQLWNAASILLRSRLEQIS